MKTLTCIYQFGYYRPGDEVQIPDDAVYDTAYFTVRPDASSSGGAVTSGGSAKSAKPSYAGPKENKA